MNINTALGKLARDQARVATSKRRPTILPHCCIGCQTFRPTRLRSSSMHFKPCATSYKTLVIAFNATLLNTRN